MAISPSQVGEKSRYTAWEGAIRRTRQPQLSFVLSMAL